MDHRRREPGRQRACTAGGTFAASVGAGGGATASRSSSSASTADAVALGVAARGGDALRLVVDREHRLPAERGGGDREHARAAAEVGERAARLDLEQQLEAHPRRRVRARAERAGGRLDHELGQRAVAGRVGGGAHAQAPGDLPRAAEAPAALQRVVRAPPRAPSERVAARGRARAPPGRERAASS